MPLPSLRAALSAIYLLRGLIHSSSAALGLQRQISAGVAQKATPTLDPKQLSDHLNSFSGLYRADLLRKSKMLPAAQKINTLLSLCSFDYDLGEIKAMNRDEARQNYKKSVPEKIANSFDTDLDLVLRIMNNFVHQRYGAKIDDPLVFGERKKSSKGARNNIFITYEQRHSFARLDSVPDSEPEHYTALYILGFAGELMKNWALERSIETLGFDSHQIFQRLKPDFLAAPTSTLYFRDPSVAIGEDVYCADAKIIDYLQTVHAAKNFGRKTAQYVEDFKSAPADFKKSGFEIKSLPFFLEGGNAIFDYKKNKLLICVSDVFFVNNKFVGAPFVVDGEVREILDYGEYCALIKNWGKENGVDIEIFERNLQKYKNRELYHLDTFVNVVGDVALVYKDGMTDESYERLKKIYGEKNIIEINKDEWKFLATNFIAVDDHNIVFGSGASKDPYQDAVEALRNVREKLNEHGICCAFSPVNMSVNGNDGIRCRYAAQRVKEAELPHELVTTLQAMKTAEASQQGTERVVN